MGIRDVRAFDLHLGLGPVPADLEEVRVEIGDRLDLYEPVLSRAEAGFVLRLTILTGDLWLAVLLAMAAVTDVGYAVVRLEIHQAERRAVRRPPVARDEE